MSSAGSYISVPVWFVAMTAASIGIFVACVVLFVRLFELGYDGFLIYIILLTAYNIVHFIGGCLYVTEDMNKSRKFWPLTYAA